MLTKIMEHLPRPIVKLLRRFVRAWRTRLPKRRIQNHYHTHHLRNALLSYITSPFTGRATLVHTNALEALLIAAALRNLKYNVDIVNYDDDRPMEYERYDLLIGFGAPVINSFAERYKPIKVISYLAGMHNYVQNLATLQRVEDVYHKRHAWLLDSGRFVAHDWTSISLISDATIALGNEVVAETYRRYTNKPLFILPSLYYELYDFREIVAGKDFSVSIKHFLWFGGSGLIHKGLDLVLETFADQPDLHLHICGPLQVESAFEACYHQELYALPNIHTYGFITLNSSTLRQLLQTCGWVILPSCAEGGGSSVLNIAANGGLVPIVTRESSIYIGDFGIHIPDLSLAGTRKAVQASQQVSPSDLKLRSLACGAYFVREHSINRYTEQLQAALEQALAF
jgi:hypothetical protein